MKKPWPCLVLVLPALLIACGGSVSVPPPAPVISVPGQPLSPPPDPDPGPDPGTLPVASLNGQLWTTLGGTGPQRHVLVRDDLDFIGWWVEPADTGPPTYGVFRGSLQAQSDSGRFSTSDMAVMRLPSGQEANTLLSMTSPDAGVSQVVFDADTDAMRAEALAHEALSMEQRSGRYAGELQLPGGREPVSLQWNADGSLRLSLTRLSLNDCQATGSASPMTGAPPRLLAFNLSFSGTGCPVVRERIGAPPVSLDAMTVSGAVDARSVDSFVLFGTDDGARMSLLLPATRVPAPALPGAWTGRNITQGFHLAVLDDLSFMGWMPSEGSSSHGIVLGRLQAPAPGDTQFQSAEMVYMEVPTYQTTGSGFAGALPVSESMPVYFMSPNARMHDEPIAHLALSMAVRSGAYTGELQLPGLQIPATLTWDANGGLALGLSGWPSCVGAGQAGALPGGPVRWLSFQLGFSGTACPSTSTGVNLSGAQVRGAVDAASGDAFVLFGADDARLAPLLLSAQRQP